MVGPVEIWDYNQYNFPANLSRRAGQQVQYGEVQCSAVYIEYSIAKDPLERSKPWNESLVRRASRKSSGLRVH